VTRFTLRPFYSVEISRGTHWIRCSRDSSVGIALGYELDDRGSRVDSRRGLGIFLFTTASRTAVEPTQPPIEWIPGALSVGIKRPGSEADHSLPSSAEVKEWVELYLHYLSTPSWRGAQLKYRDNFTFTFTHWIRSLVGAQSLSGRGGAEKNPYPYR
jgi:hypothetical protein